MNLGNGLLLLLVGGCFFLMMKRGFGCCGGRHTESNSCHRSGNGSSNKTMQEEVNSTSGGQAFAKPEPHKGSSDKGVLASLALATLLTLGTSSPLWANAAHHAEQAPTPPPAASTVTPQETASLAVTDEKKCKEKCTTSETNGTEEMAKPVMPKVGGMNPMTGGAPMMGMMKRKQGMETMMDMCKMTQQTKMKALPETKSH